MRNACAGSANEALDLMRNAVMAREPFKIVLLDMGMPEMDGLTLARKIKSNPAFASTHLVMLTSLGHPPSERSWKEAGIGAYLVKPVKQNRLLETLAQIIRMPETQILTQPETKAVSVAAPRKTKTTIRILLAEDNVVNQKVALRQLKKLGYAVDAVNNGLEAIKAMERQLYPVILMDCQMPELDGYKATERIRQMQTSSLFRWPNRPYIIAMTANALAGDREACLASGMDDYVSKPVRIEDLEEALQRSLSSMDTHNNPNPAPNDALIDFEAIENLRALRMEGEPDPLAELIELFLSDTPKRLEQINAALKNSAAHDLESAAHSLKGSASNLGATSLAAACARLMQNARNNELAIAASAAQSVEEQFAKVKEALLQELKK